MYTTRITYYATHFTKPKFIRTLPPALLHLRRVPAGKVGPVHRLQNLHDGHVGQDIYKDLPHLGHAAAAGVLHGE